MTLISIVIPAYNRYSLIQTAINSINKQTFQDYEIIVVDDGSNIPLVKLENEYKKVRVIRHSIN